MEPRCTVCGVSTEPEGYNLCTACATQAGKLKIASRKAGAEITFAAAVAILERPRGSQAMSYHGPKKAEIDTGYVYGWNAARITVHERGYGKWEVVWHAVRGPEVSLGTFATKDEAVKFGWKTYNRHMGIPEEARS